MGPTGSSPRAPSSGPMAGAISGLRRGRFTMTATRGQDVTQLPSDIGRPEGAVHVRGAVVARHTTTCFALEVRPVDIFHSSGGQPPAPVPVAPVVDRKSTTLNSSH